MRRKKWKNCQWILRKTVTALLTLALVGSMTACSNSETQADVSEPETKLHSESSTETLELEEGTESSESEEITENSNILIVYFSRWGNTEYSEDVDATTSASILLDGEERYGTTEYVANMIQREIGGDVHLIETVDTYTADFEELRDVNHDEMNSNYLPELKESDLDIAQYDTVFIGYPVWATSVPQAVLSFLNQYDLAGKTVIPFCTHDGYGAGASYQTIADASHAGTTLDGIAIEAKDVSDAQETIVNWLSDIGMMDTEEQQTGTAITITIGDTILDGVLYDTALANEIKEYFPLTISMSGYGGREYYGGVDFYPENLNGGQRHFENGDITYCEAHHNMAIFYAQTDDPELSVDVIPIGRVTSDLSVFDTLDSREEITFSLAE